MNMWRFVIGVVVGILSTIIFISGRNNDPQKLLLSKVEDKLTVIVGFNPNLDSNLISQGHESYFEDGLRVIRIFKNKEDAEDYKKRIHIEATK